MKHLSQSIGQQPIHARFLVRERQSMLQMDDIDANMIMDSELTMY
ncbi:hypothetical protein [Paenibacillus sp. LPE1-1-1.1]